MGGVDQMNPALTACPSADEVPSSFETFVMNAVRAATMDAQAAVTPAHPLLNGVAYSVFRRDVCIDTRREIGAFFSSGATARALTDLLAGLVAENDLVLDPTCGIGDLLLARAADLPLGDSLRETLSIWGDRLAGFDTREDLVQLCKTRLCTLARARGNFDDVADPLQSFPKILVQDMFALESRELMKEAGAILFNPPFGKTKWPEKLDWAAGEINAAAIFLDHLTKAVRPTVPIAALLPEVLRCGSRYARFRSELTDRGYTGTFHARGRFDAWTDVDVFATLLSRGEADGSLWRHETADGDIRLEDRYEVRVGSVVPHRDSLEGAQRLYICAKTTPAWETAFTPNARRGYAGRVFQPPFVAIRRTSSPSDKWRAVGTIVTADEPVAVENHLLVAIPKDNSIAACEALISVLRAPATNDRLNELMRCRHLTTGAIKALPWILIDE